MTGVHATARLTAAPDGRGGTALPLLTGDGPLALRRTRSAGPEAHVTVVGAMSAPLGGDRLAIEAVVEPGAALRIGTAAATVSLPGRTGEQARYDVRLTVGEDAVLHWLPEPLIAAEGSDLRMTTTVELAPGARLVLREEQILGRSGEHPGRLTTRLTVRLSGRPLLDQELSFGPNAPGWAGPAVLHGHRAAGQLLVVDPEYADKPIEPRVLSSDQAEGEAVLTPLAGPAALITAVAPDGLRLRRLLSASVAP
ncbi:urease accessory protein UreD [Actinacidiphila soli]|uniref:urease accessory protein UreD n=1 Tax=Actinacidiphila soli TaxID=2487275 RepID=UPI001F0C6981|nr:urease accessory protein UreD [Actinacidiphila soli]